MGRPKTVSGTCGAEGCDRPAKTKGLCQKHYMRLWHHGHTGLINTGEKRSHPLYSIWFERKQFGSLCAEWRDDFWAFVAAVGERPTPTHLLRPLRPGEPYGPGNWEWLDALRRQPGETKKAFDARKWASRRARFPEYEGHRSMMRKYGVAPDEFRAMQEAQGDVCAICGKAETRINPKTHAAQALAVDHCHTTKKVRQLLCWRCNTTIGKVEESTDLLRKMIDYLDHWK